MNPRTTTVRPAQARQCVVLLTRLMLALGCATLIVNSVQAQTQAVGWHTIAGGGGQSTNGAFAIRGTIGQSSSRRVVGGNTTIQAGFWSLLATSVPPSILTQPQSRTNLLVTTATFSVTATGDAPLSYQWRKGDVNLSNTGNSFGVNTPTLTLTNLQLTDAGDFTVVVTNVAGVITSAVATLTMLPEQDAITLVNGGSIVGYWYGGMGFSFSPATNLMVTRVGYRDTGVTNPIVSFWITNEVTFNYDVVASYALPPGSNSLAMISTNIAFTLLAGSNYSITLQDGPLAANNLMLVFAPRAGAFVVAAQLTNVANVTVNSNGVFSPSGPINDGILIGPDFTFDVSSPAVAPVMLTAPTFGPGDQFQFTLTGQAGASYAIQRSTNLPTTNWTFIYTNTAPFTFTETNAGNFPQRFYRAVTLP